MKKNRLPSSMRYVNNNGSTDNALHMKPHADSMFDVEGDLLITNESQNTTKNMPQHYMYKL